MVQQWEYENKERLKWQRIQDELDEKYKEGMREYWNKRVKLQQEKEAFIQSNPDFPCPDLLFLNVIAPPQRLIVNLI